MALLKRFRPQGGFTQLLQLVETCDPQKQKSLLEQIAKEDPGWAHLIRLKLLNLQRILNWPESVLSKVWSAVPLPIIVAVWQKADTQTREKLEASLPRAFHSPFRKAVDEINSMDDAEVAIAVQRLVAIVREMQLTGSLRFQEFDPSLDFDSALAERQDPFKSIA